MPPKVKFTKDEIVAAALRVARTKGAAAVTTRDIGAELGVSTRPIFTYFNTMDEVREEMYRAAMAVYRGYIAEGLKQAVPFSGVGVQYLRFVREEPQLYRFLFLTPRPDGSSSAMAAMRESQEQVQESLMRIYRMTEQEANRLFRDVWIAAHGLATLIVTGGCTYTDRELAEILTSFSVSACKAIKEVPGFTDGTFDRDEVFRKIIGP